MREIFDWIPVTSELPKQHERVLVVCYNLQNHTQRHISISSYYVSTTGRVLWSGKKKVTHWMRLPDLPDDPGKEYLKAHNAL